MDKLCDFYIIGNSDFIKYNTITTQNPTQIIGVDQYVYTINGNPLSIIIGSNGFGVTAHPGI